MSSSSSQSTTQKASHRRLTAVTAIVTFVLVLAISGVVYFLANSTPAAGMSRIANAPTSAHVIDLGGLIEDGRLESFGNDQQPYLDLDDGYLLALTSNSGQSTLLALDDLEEGTFPRWSLEVPADAVQEGCQASATTVECGLGASRTRIDLASGVPTSTAEAPAPDKNEEKDAEKDKDAEGSEPAEGAAGTAGGTESFPLSRESSTDMPYWIDGGQIHDASGTVVSTGLPSHTFWGTSTPNASQWIFSDGKTILAIAGKKELWRQDLPQGAADLNGFGDSSSGPVWLVSDDALIIGTPDAVEAWATETGETLWRIEAPVTSWRSSDELLLVTTEDSLSLMPYPEDPGEEGDFEIQRASDGMPTAETIANSTLQISENCADFAGVDDFRAAKFADGTAGPGGDYGYVSQTGVGYTFLDGKPRVVVSFFCTAGGTGHFGSLAVYDENLDLVATSMGLMEELHWTSQSAAPAIYDLNVFGNTVSFSTGTIQVTGYGGQGSDGIDATVTALWNGTEYETVDIVYDTPDGPVRAPDLDFMQDLFEKARSKQDDAIAPYVDQNVLAAVHEADAFRAEAEAAQKAGNDQTGYEGAIGRFGFAPEEGSLDGCTLVPNPLMAGAYIEETSRSIEPTYGGWQSSYGNLDVQPGDFVCGISMTPEQVHETSRPYDLWWYVRTDYAGTPHVFGVQRTFS